MNYFKAILSGVLLMTMTACTAVPAAQEPASSEQPAAENAKEEESMKISDQEIQTLLDVYKTVLNETFGADIDFSKPAKQDETATYYTVRNFMTIDEIKEHISQYCMKDAYEPEEIKNDFTETDGKLMAVRGGRGYAYYSIDPAKWQRIDDTSVKVQFMILDDIIENTMAVITFAKDDGVWKVSSFTKPDVE